MINRTGITRSSILATLGILLIVGIGFMFSSDTQQAEKQIEYADFHYDHPFDLEATRLTEKRIKDSIANASKLNEQELNAGLQTVFSEEGLLFTLDTLLTIGDLKIPITAYNEEEKIGYVLIDHNMYGEGLSNLGVININSQKECEREILNQLDRGIEMYLEDSDRFLNDLFNKPEDHPEAIERRNILAEWQTARADLEAKLVTFEEVTDKFQAYSKMRWTRIQTMIDDWTFFKGVLNRDSEIFQLYATQIRTELDNLPETADQIEYLEIVFMDMRKKLTLDHLAAKQNKTIVDDWMLSATQKITDPLRLLAMMQRIKEHRIISPNESLQQSHKDHMHAIISTNNKKDWWSHTEALIDLLNHNTTLNLHSQLSYHELLVDILADKNWSNWSKRYHEIQELADLESISMHELKSLDAIAHEHGIFLAPISTYDARIIYDMQEEAYNSQLKHLRNQIKSEASKAKRKILQDQLREITANRSTNYPEIRTKAKKKSIEQLKKDLKSYIEWAREEHENYIARNRV